MATKMNSKTHKIITATYYPIERHFVVPIDWDIEDISIRYDQVFHKKEFQEVPVKQMEHSDRYPETIEEADWEDCAGYFSCCESEEEDDNCAECCRCGEDVSNDEGEGKAVNGEYWCVDCVDDFAHRCELCNKFFEIQGIEYLPSKEDKEKKELLGNDYCIECYKKVEKFEFVENIV